MTPPKKKKSFNYYVVGEVPIHVPCSPKGGVPPWHEPEGVPKPQENARVLPEPPLM
jgi:hypothetical protein